MALAFCLALNVADRDLALLDLGLECLVLDKDARLLPFLVYELLLELVAFGDDFRVSDDLHLLCLLRLLHQLLVLLL